MMLAEFEAKNNFIGDITQNLKELSSVLYHKNLTYELSDIENFINHKDNSILYLADTEQNGMY